MPSSEESVYDLNKGIFPSNSAMIENYSTNLYINKERTTQSSNFSISVRFNIFTMLFLTFLFFLLEIIRKNGNLANSIMKFNKDHIRILAMKEPENMNDHMYNNKSRKKYNESFNYKKRYLIKEIFYQWEWIMHDKGVRHSINGRKWENEKFMQLYNTITKDIEDFHNKAVEEHQKLKENCPDDKEYSTFFKMKKKEFSKFCKDKKIYISEYINSSIKEWSQLRNS